MNHFYKPDSWTLTHLFGSFYLTRCISHFPDLTMIQAAIIALVIGIAWEIIVDQFQVFPIFAPDTRGWDLTDIIADGVGCTLALWV